jgi:two-component system, cell cycle sensor histidine kinase and response regulator CckA
MAASHATSELSPAHVFPDRFGVSESGVGEVRNLEPSPREIRVALDESFLKQFRHLLSGFIVLVAWLAAVELPRWAHGEPHYLLDRSLVLALLIALRVALTRWSPSAALVHPLGVLVIAVMLADGLYFVLSREVKPSTIPLAFVFMVTGSLFLSVRWYVLTMFAVLAVWFGLTYWRIEVANSEEYIAGVFMFAFLSALLFSYRLRSETSIVRLRIRDEIQKEGMSRALAEAHEQIAERRRSETALRESEQRYRNVIDRTPTGIIIHNDEALLLVNREFANFLGWDNPRSMEGMKLRDLLHPDDYESAAGSIANILGDRKTPRIDVRLRGSDGNYRLAEVAGHAVGFDGKRVIQTVVQDVADRRRAEEKLRRSEARYRLLAENVTDGIWTSDLNLRFTYLSPSATRMLGMTLEEAVDREIGEVLRPESLAKAYRTLQAEVERARRLGAAYESGVTLELELARADGSSLWAEVTARILLDDQWEPTGVMGVTRDITERRNAREALRRSEEQYRHVVEQALVGIVVHDGETVQFVNPACARLLGAECPKDVIGHRIWEFVHPDDAEAAAARIRTQLETGQATARSDIRLVGADGVVREAEITGQVIGKGPDPVIQAVIQEVTESRRAERALRQSEARYRLLAENVTDGIWVADFDLRFTYFSPSIEKIFRVPVETALRIPVERMMVPESLERAKRVLAEQVCMARVSGPKNPEERTIELEFFRGDGVPIWTEVKTRILYDESGQPESLLGVTREITERRRAEKELRNSEERYRLLAEYATDVIFTTDISMRITFISPAVKRLIGYDADELLGQSFIGFMTSGSAREAQRIIQEELELDRMPGADLKRSRTLEIEYVIRGGGTVWTEVRWSFIRDEQGRPVGLHGVERDISERRAAEAEKRKLEAQLLQSQKLESLGTLAGGIAHDFNNLLGGILGYAEMLKLEARPGDSVYESADVIETAATRARELTRQLLGFARKGKHQNTAVLLKHTIQEVVSLLGRTLNKNVHIVQSLRAGDAAILGDPAQLHQVLLNLALNASDAMPEGGVLEFETGLRDAQELRKTHPEAAAGPYVWVSVADSGMGISPEIRDRIFEPFFTTKEPGRGTGMGLAMVYGIVKNHGGFIELRSDVGKGTRFTLYFPLVNEQAASARREPVQAAVKGSGRILLVDDESVVRTMAGKMLERLGFTVIPVADGQEAAEYYAAHRDDIDLVLLDMIMPRVSGRECFQRLREINPDVHVVLTTGYGQDSAAQQIIDEGAVGFIQKPYQSAELFEVINRALAL